MIRLSVLLVMLAGSAHAQEPKFDISLTEDCVAETTNTLEKEACVGNSTTQCVIDMPGGVSTPGMVTCFGIELSYWEARLDDSYDSLLVRLTKWDVDKEAGDTLEVPLLLEMQGSWIAFRDASCAFLLARTREAGDAADFMTVTCLNSLTARQVMYLEEMDRDI